MNIPNMGIKCDVGDFYLVVKNAVICMCQDQSYFSGKHNEITITTRAINLCKSRFFIGEIPVFSITRIYDHVVFFARPFDNRIAINSSETALALATLNSMFELFGFQNMSAQINNDAIEFIGPDADRYETLELSVQKRTDELLQRLRENSTASTTTN